MFFIFQQNTAYEIQCGLVGSEMCIRDTLDTMMSVTLPLILPGLVTGLLLAFARGLGEFGATITFVANIPGETQTLPIALYSALQSPDGEIRALRLYTAHASD